MESEREESEGERDEREMVRFREGKIERGERG